MRKNRKSGENKQEKDGGFIISLLFDIALMLIGMVILIGLSDVPFFKWLSEEGGLFAGLLTGWGTILLVLCCVILFFHARKTAQKYRQFLNKKKR